DLIISMVKKSLLDQLYLFKSSNVLIHLQQLRWIQNLFINPDLPDDLFPLSLPQVSSSPSFSGFPRLDYT
ncbi:MAG: hypothetical protein QNK35_16735, partial [Bacteroides sp.]|nr:hypothetical protein [Bacteroides sp.]